MSPSHADHLRAALEAGATLRVEYVDDDVATTWTLQRDPDGIYVETIVTDADTTENLLDHAAAHVNLRAQIADGHVPTITPAG